MQIYLFWYLPLGSTNMLFFFFLCKIEETGYRKVERNGEVLKLGNLLSEEISTLVVISRVDDVFKFSFKMCSSKLCPILEYFDDFLSVVGNDERMGEAAVGGVVLFNQLSL